MGLNTNNTRKFLPEVLDSTLKLPFAVKAPLLLVGIYVLVSMLSLAQSLILPLVFAGIGAILISPAVSFLVRKKINRALAVVAVLVISLLIFAAIIALLSSQANRLVEAFPRLVDKFEALSSQTIAWISGYFSISTREINEWFSLKKEELLNNSGATIGFTLVTMGGAMATVFLTPVYIFLILYYQPHLLAFFRMLFGNSNRIREILSETKNIIQSYLVGLFIQFCIIATLNSTGLFIIGIDYALLLGIAGALLNIIPYVGGFVAASLFMVVALISQSPIYALYVFALYLIIQFIDNNFIVPKIIGSKVKLNALVSLIAVVLGAALWGIPGMFLSIPLVAVLKLIFDHVDSMKPWGFLMGQVLEVRSRAKPIFRASHNVPAAPLPPENM